MSALLDLGCNISASSQPCWLWTGPHNLNWLWPIYPVTVCSEFRVSVYRQTPSACLKSEVKGDCVNSQGPLCSPTWWVFSLQVQSFSLYLWCIGTSCCLVTKLHLTLYDPIDCSQASLSFTTSQSLLKFMSIEFVMTSNYLNPSSPSPPAFNLSQHQGLFQ